MKARVVVTAEDGGVWSGEVQLVRDGETRRPGKHSTQAVKHVHAAAGPSTSDLKLPARAFFRKFASKTTAASKFTLVVAQIAQGIAGREVQVSQVEEVWRQNSGVLGGPYQTMYGTRAKEKGWVNSTKRGVFVLMDGWRTAAHG